VTAWAEVRDRLRAGTMTPAELTKTIGGKGPTATLTDLFKGAAQAPEVAKTLAERGDLAGAATAWEFADEHPAGDAIRPGDVAELDTPLGQVVGIVNQIFETSGQVSVRLLEELEVADSAGTTTLPVGTERTFALDTVVGFAHPVPAEPVEPPHVEQSGLVAHAREQVRAGQNTIRPMPGVAPNRAILDADPDAGSNITHAGRTR
jgi:hypothetical protein